MDIPHDPSDHNVSERGQDIITVPHDHTLPRFARHPLDPPPYPIDLTPPPEKSIYNYLGGNLLAEVELNSSAIDDFGRKRRSSNRLLVGDIGARKRQATSAGPSSSAAVQPQPLTTSSLDYNQNDPSNADAANFFHQHPQHHHNHHSNAHHHSHRTHHLSSATPNGNSRAPATSSPKIPPSSPSGSDHPSAPDADENILESSSLPPSASRFDTLCSALGLDLEQKDRLLQLSSNIHTSAERDLVMIGLLVSSSGKPSTSLRPTISTTSSSSATWSPSKSTKDFIKSACRSFVTSSNVRGYGTYAGEAVMDYLTKQRHNVTGWPDGFINDPSDFVAKRLLRDVVDKELIELRSQLKKELCRGMPKSSNSLGPTDPIPRDPMPPIEKVAEMIEKLGQRRSDSKSLPILEPGTEDEMIARAALLRTLVATCFSGRRGHFWRWADEVIEKLSSPSITIEYKQAILAEVVEHDRNMYPKHPPKYFEEESPSILPALLHDLTLKAS